MTEIMEMDVEHPKSFTLLMNTLRRQLVCIQELRATQVRHVAEITALHGEVADRDEVIEELRKEIQRLHIVQSGGWIEWNGASASPPVAPDALVQVRFCGGDVSRDSGRPSKEWYWRHKNYAYDIVAYRLAGGAT
jgi:hypothetical protein